MLKQQYEVPESELLELSFEMNILSDPNSINDGVQDGEDDNY